jgi:primosomal protein N' (replication factor Y) (superfamily II helicase)
LSAACSSLNPDIRIERVVQVAVPVPNLDLLTYAVPAGFNTPAIGARVVVSLGTRIVTGIVIENQNQNQNAERRTPNAEPGRREAIKPLRAVLDADAFVPPDVIALAKWTAEYYAAGVGDTIPLLLPPMARGGRADAHKTIRVAAITPLGLEALSLELAGKQREALELLAGTPSGIATPVLAARGFAADGISRLVRRGYISIRHDHVDRDPWPFATSPPGGPARGASAAGDSAPGDRAPGGSAPGGPAPDDRLVGVARFASIGEATASDTGAAEVSHRCRSGVDQMPALETDRVAIGSASEALPISIGSAAGTDRVLTGEQHEALGRLTRLAAGDFRVALLHGVTGSGKTEIYIRLSAAVCASGHRVLMLVPEIALTPATAALFRDAFGERVAIQHSGLSDGERHDQWQRIRRGDVDIVVGTRSAVFAPIARLGLIIVDEEHDASYKQEESPRYNGRDVAIVRARRAGALVVLGSATPSMESYHNAVIGKYERVVLERRVLDRPLASVTIVDMREEYAAAGPDVILSRALRDGIAARLERREQSLVLLNRRGFATAVFCRQCAATIDCPNCSVSLVVHGEGAARRARCHYCNYTQRVPPACPLCAGPYLEQAGFGTERVEAELKAACPGARVARLDRDAVRRKGALAALLSRFRDGEIDVLVGTQMIAKGHDFPRVTLVGVVSADVGLGVADFRASERTFQLLTQVAGRAGRGEQRGEAIVQTIYPDHYSIQLACRQDYAAFFERELRFRKAMRYPPLVSLVNTIVRARTFSGAMDDAADVVEKVRRSSAASDMRVLGPAPAPLGRLRGEYRAQLLIKGANRRAMRETLQAAIAGRPELHRRVVVDVDPLSVL